MKYRILNTIGIISVIYVNYLANALPINGYNTGQLSDFYPNLFVPAGLTFSIWGIIYLFLIAFTIGQWFKRFDTIIEKIGYTFMFNCAMNVSWILAWHFRYEELSVIIMLALLGSLIRLFHTTQKQLDPSFINNLLFRIPFGIYFGWICVATIANITTLLIHWGFEPTNPAYWAAAMIIITQALVWLINSRYSGLAYTLVIIWAISGIILKQSRLNGPELIVYTGYACIVTSAIIFAYSKLANGIKSSIGN